MRSFRILLVSPIVGVGGTELITLTLARGLLKRKHHIYIFANDDGFLSEEYKKFGVKFIEGNAYPPKKSILKIIKTIYHLRKCIIHNNIEIVHAQMAWPIPLIYIASMFIKSRRLKIIWHCRGIKDNNYKIVGRLFNYLTDFVITNCHYERKKLLRNGMKYSHVKTIYNAPNIEIPSEIPIHKDSSLLKELHITDDTAIIGSVSRLAQEKGVKYFIEAAAEVIKECLNVKFLVVGDGTLRRNLEEQSQKLGLEENILFIGARRDMKRIYSITDILVNPLLIGRGTGNVNAEAMAFGKPVIATKVGGVPEIVIDGENGFLVPFRDPNTIAEKIIELLNNQALRKSMGEAGRKQVERYFSQERFGDEVEKVYRALVKNQN